MKLIKRKWPIYLLILFLTGCINNSNEEIETNGPLHHGENERNYLSVESEEIVSENLMVPWSITKHENTLYVSERQGTIVKIEDGKSVREKVELEKPVLEYGEGGLLGLVLHPEFKTNQLAFAYHTYGITDEVKNRVVVIKYEKDKWVEQKALLENIEGANNHNGGRIKIGPDNKLYISTGDALNPDLAQNPDILAGSILRMEVDGTIPSDNPFTESYVYSFGHRNPQGLAWDKEDGQMYASEHGPTARDEINKIEAGKNYGWPIISGDDQNEEMVTPLFHSGENTWAPSGIDYVNGALLVANLRGEMVRAFHLKTKEEYPLWEGNGRIRDVLADGKNLYVVTNNTDGRGNPRPSDDILVKLTLTSSEH